MAENNSSNSGMLLWIGFMICFSLIPLLLFASGVIHVHNLKFEAELSHSSQNFSQIFDQFTRFKNPQQFWCNFLKNAFPANSNKKFSDKTMLKRLDFLRKKYGMNYIVQDASKRTLHSSFRLESQKDWLVALNVIRKSFNYHKELFTMSVYEERILGKVFGPQFNFKHIREGVSDELFLCWPDSTDKKPKFWSNKIGEKILLVFVPDNLLKNGVGELNTLENLIKRKKFPKYGFALEINGKTRFISPNIATRKAEIEKYLQTYDSIKRSHIVTDNFVFYPKFIKPGVTLHGVVPISSFQKIPPGFVVLPLILLLFASFFMGRYSYRVFVLGEPDSLSLKWKLRFLFFFANGLPLVVLFFIGNDYLNQKRGTILKEVQTKGISFLQNLDEKFETEYAHRLINKRRAVSDFLKSAKTDGLTEANLSRFNDSLKKPIWKVFLVASQTDLIGTHEGLVDEKAGILPRFLKQDGKRGKNQIEFLRKIGHFFLGTINKTKVSAKNATEMEMIVESATQKPLANFINDLLVKSGKFTMWGFGDNSHPSIIDYFSYEGNEKFDYFFLSMWRKESLQNDFLKENYTKANRNKLSLKVMAINPDRGSFSYPRAVLKSKSIKDFSRTLTSYPPNDLKFLIEDNKTYLVMGFRGKFLNTYNLIGMFPLEIMEKQIRLQRQQLMTFAFLSLLLAFGLSQMLAQSFLEPLKSLSEGASAIEAKNFHHRLPSLGKDEFGEMGEVFNDVMVDLEELSVASAIQEQLLPSSDIQTQNFSLYGKSVSMGELGGDYFDFIELENSKFSVLLGDVAGHGVGAALIMAMAKAGVVQSEHLLDKPLELISRLHELIYASKTKKQRKIMTCQYLCLDGENGSGVYSNAGACSPFIIRHSQNKIEELTLSGAALGAFKKGKFSEIEVKFNPGDAIIFYTDGIVETRNSKGEEIGYERLQQIFVDCWNLDAETYYQNIFDTYLEHLGDEDPQDDLTMVILVFNPGKTRIQKQDLQS